MQISTKTLASLLLTTSTALTSGKMRRSKGWPKKSRLERILQRHDRKGELRAEVLGTSPEDFRYLHKQFSLEEVVRRHGFLDENAFVLALMGKIRNELRQRGWSSNRIDAFLRARNDRMSRV